MNEIYEYIEDNKVEINGTSYSLDDYNYDNFIILIEELKDSLERVISKINELDINDAILKKIEILTDESIDFIKKEIIDLNKHDYNDLSVQYRRLYWRLYYDFYDGIRYICDYDTVFFLDELKNIHIIITSGFKKISSLDKLESISSSVSNGIVIIGTNGSGKSSFVSFLKNIYRNEMVLIPSQRFLFFSLDINSLYLKDVDDVQNNQNENHIENFKQGMNESIFEEFSTIIIALGKKYIADLDNNHNNNVNTKTILEEFNNIWKKVIPNITFDFDKKSLIFKPKTLESYTYEINELSDGEKAIFYYIGNVLLAKENSYIIVDEPENNLNSSVYNKLWDILENIRSDCNFVYISHSIDFVQARRKMKLIWMKEYLAPDEWNFEEVGDRDDLPTDLVLKIYGTTDIVLFCEGNKDSLDYKVYDSLFGNECLITPVEGCENVKKYTQLTNKLGDKINKKAIGIIDYDNRSDDELEKLKENKIFGTKYNEIEMLLCSEVIMYKVLEPFENEKKIIDKKISDFQTNVLNIVKKKKNEIALRALANHYNLYLSKYKVDTPNSIEEFSNQISEPANQFNYKQIYEEISEKINVSIESGDFNEVLKHCDLKNEISRGIANREIDNDYIEKALGIVKNNQEVREILLNSYFPDLKNQFFDKIM